MSLFYHREDGLTHTTVTFRPTWYVCRYGGFVWFLTSVLARDWMTSELGSAYTILFWTGCGLLFAPTLATWGIRREAQTKMVSGGLVVQGSPWNFQNPVTWTWPRT